MNDVNAHLLLSASNSH